jgi:hypothetical protein
MKERTGSNYLTREDGKKSIILKKRKNNRGRGNQVI